MCEKGWLGVHWFLQARVSLLRSSQLMTVQFRLCFIIIECEQAEIQGGSFFRHCLKMPP